MVALDTGATANLVCLRRLQRRYRLPEKDGYQKVSAYPSTAGFRFGDERLGEVRRAADSLAGIAGS